MNGTDSYMSQAGNPDKSGSCPDQVRILSATGVRRTGTFANFAWLTYHCYDYDTDYRR